MVANPGDSWSDSDWDEPLWSSDEDEPYYFEDERPFGLRQIVARSPSPIPPVGAVPPQGLRASPQAVRSPPAPEPVANWMEHPDDFLEEPVSAASEVSRRRRRVRQNSRPVHHAMRRRSSGIGSSSSSQDNSRGSPPANQMGDRRYRSVDAIVSHQYRRGRMTFRVLRACSLQTGWRRSYYTLGPDEVLMRPTLARAYLVELSERRSLRSLQTVLRRVPGLRGLLKRRLLAYFSVVPKPEP